MEPEQLRILRALRDLDGEGYAPDRHLRNGAVVLADSNRLPSVAGPLAAAVPLDAFKVPVGSFTSEEFQQFLALCHSAGIFNDLGEPDEALLAVRTQLSPELLSRKAVLS